MKWLNSKSEKMSFFETGLASITFGLVVKAFSATTPIGAIPLVAGGGLCLYGMMKKSDDYESLFLNCGLKNKQDHIPMYKGKTQKTYGYDLMFTLPVGLSTGDVEKHKQRIEQYLNSKVKIHYVNNLLIIAVYEKQLNNIYDFEIVESDKPLKIPIGYAVGDQLVHIDLSETHHMLIAGETGSGKSTQLRIILSYLLLAKSSNTVDIYLSDLKCGVEFNIFAKCKQVKGFATNVQDTYEIIKNLTNEINRRYKIFAEKECVDIGEYNKKFKNKKMNYKLLVIDEFADLSEEKDSINELIEFARKARAAGISLILSTQRPCSKTIDSKLKSNIPTLMALKTSTAINSRVVIEREGLEKLRGSGHGFLRCSGKEVEFQGMNLIPERARELLRPYYKKSNNSLSKKSKAATFTRAESKGEVKDFEFLKLLEGDNLDN